MVGYLEYPQVLWTVENLAGQLVAPLACAMAGIMVASMDYDLVVVMVVDLVVCSDLKVGRMVADLAVSKDWTLVAWMVGWLVVGLVMNLAV